MYIYIYIIYIYIHTTQSVQILQKQDGYNTYLIFARLLPKWLRGNVAIEAVGHMMYVMYIELLYCL